ncbi:MAG: glutamyl-tRNA amidotransferase [Bacteroidetes bacterium MedPE-SWsnd-G1]|uniref:GatB/YqeY domain-containing protein n=1 Tax=Urechidicola vernalis TaxID=3075600 RepID=A0ABU2Y5D0_9FLAO|nr:GatB/YqeY domain-containing protein [Urechidicola sp. P050]MDT0552902.1 GatB/YqeY domain-containing protein [Urechidicola sp. P050]OIQ41809.1 MAG: glutamyl-tRNA amidotransferase [Bacteroidetes bacterium MedPE-SWsnd-G1]
MSLQAKIMVKMKEAMKSKDSVALQSLRAVKSEILLAQTKGGDIQFGEAEEIKLLQKLVKQRKDSAALYVEQSRQDLADPELAEAEIIAQFLPAQMSTEDLKTFITDLIAKVGADGMKDMGKVMGIASKELAGKADGKAISTIVKELLSK